MKALIDGDILLYSVGHAIDERYYTVQQERFTYKADAVQYCEDTCTTVDQIKFHREAAPLPFYLHGLKQKISSILQATECDEYILYLTGDNNFREEVATTHVYKGTRPADGKPLLYQEMRDYLIHNHPCEVCEGYEADDGMSISQMKNYYQSEPFASEGCCNTGICSLDKDLDMVPGWHYNWNSGEKYFITWEQGIRNFWQQMLTGDSVDNIHGIKGIGKKKAEKLLKDCETSEEMRRVVALQYAIYFDNPEERLWENSGLLWMCRTEDDILAPGQTPLKSMYNV